MTLLDFLAPFFIGLIGFGTIFIIPVFLSILFGALADLSLTIRDKFTHRHR